MQSSQFPFALTLTPARQKNKAATSRLGRGWFISLLLLGTCLVAGQAQGSIISGENAVLQSAHGKVLIPLSDGASGALGDHWLTNPRRHVGRDVDSVRIAQGASSGGSVSFFLDFDLTGQFGEGGTIEQETATMLLTVVDLDLRHVVGGKQTYWETMDLTFMNMGDSVVDPGLSTLQVTQANYGDFRDDGAGLTDRKAVTYSLGLANDLNVAQADFDEMMADRSFRLLVTLNTHVERTGRGRGTYKNTRESFGGNFQFAQAYIPEPTVMAILAAGGIGLALRRRSRDGR